ncbi:MAG: 4-phosphoerythronate dehydrogenase [Lachnospiraceae bacterium]|nr:4-phosphoerythronate dehydrogenase [Lachnospiraceae bacterium]
MIDKNIPFIQGLLEPYGRVDYLSEPEMTPEAVCDADALLVRTRTKCGEALLGASKCRFVGTCTIGTDHLDLPWLASRGIVAANAPGCNAPAVAQYVFASILRLHNRPLSQYAIGIVGVGNVGKIVERWARQLDMKVMVNDPPRQAAEGGGQWSSLEEIAEKADIITFHTPLDNSTRHLADEAFFNSLRRAPIIINAARGPIVDNSALVEAIAGGKVSHAVIDCWEGEPSDLNPRLLELADIATPHIAGYSYEGKVRATRMALDALCRALSLPHIEMVQKAPAGAAESVNAKSIMQSYDPLADTKMLKANPKDFEDMRNHYILRHEASVGKID